MYLFLPISTHFCPLRGGLKKEPSIYIVQCLSFFSDVCTQPTPVSQPQVRALVISLPAFREWPVGDRSLASDHLGRLLTKLAADPPAFHRLSQPAFCGQRGRSHDNVYSTPPTPLNKHAVNAASPNRITTSRV